MPHSAPEPFDPSLFAHSMAPQRLVQFLAIEARPKTILLVGGTTRLQHHLEDTFPQAVVWCTSWGLLAGAPMADAVVSVFGISDSEWSDADSLDQLLAHVNPEGHLAFLEPSAGTATTRSLSRWLGTAIRPSLTTLASMRLVMRTALEVPRWMGLWHEALFVGRRAGSATAGAP